MPVARDLNHSATRPSHDVVYLPPVVRTPSRSRRSTVTLALLGCLAGVVALANPSDPAPPAAAAPADRGGDPVHELDFRTVTQPGSVCADALDAPPRLITVVDGASGVLDDATVTRLSIDDEVLYADLDGDGGDEAVVRVSCDFGANGVQDSVQVWRSSGRLTQLVDTVSDAPGSVAGDSAFPPGVAAVALDGPAVEITWHVWGDDDPHCCPSRQAVVAYELDGGLEVTGEPVVEPAAD